jgi:copper(I)-binding protein
MRRFVFTVAALLLATSAFAQVSVKDPWIRATVPQQKTTGIFMELKSDVDLKLVAARTPVAGAVEFHQMMMHGDNMHMHALSSVDLPAGQAVALRPGSFHLMLLDLKQQVHAGAKVPVTLVFESKDGHRHTLDVQATARVLNATSE